MAEKASVGVPSVSGMKNAFMDYGIGAVGGLIYALSTAMFGSGLIGSLASAILAGSVVKGQRGTALATIAGFMALAGAFNGTATASTASDSDDVM